MFAPIWRFKLIVFVLYYVPVFRGGSYHASLPRGRQWCQLLCADRPVRV